MKKLITMLICAAIIVCTTSCSQTDKKTNDRMITESLSIYLCDDVYRTDDTPTHGSGTISLPLADSGYTLYDAKLLLCDDECDPAAVVSRASQGYAPVYRIVQTAEYTEKDGYNYPTRQFSAKIPEPMLEDLQKQGVLDTITARLEREYYYLLTLDDIHYAYISIDPTDENSERPIDEESIVNEFIKNAEIEFTADSKNITYTIKEAYEARAGREQMHKADVKLHSVTFTDNSNLTKQVNDIIYEPFVQRYSAYKESPAVDFNYFSAENLIYEGDKYLSIASLSYNEGTYIVFPFVSGAVVDLKRQRLLTDEELLNAFGTSSDTVRSEIEELLPPLLGDTTAPMILHEIKDTYLNKKGELIVIFSAERLHMDPPANPTLYYNASKKSVCHYPLAKSFDELEELFCQPSESSIVSSELYNRTTEFLEQEFHRVYDPHYDIQSLTVSSWNEHGSEATFFYTMAFSYYGEVPEVNAGVHDVNYEFKVVLNEGDLELYANVSPKDVVWEPIKIDDYILGS